MEANAPTNGSNDHLTYRGYQISVTAHQGPLKQWTAQISVSREGASINLDEPESIGPFWSTPQEAVRDGVERARYLLDRRDGVLDGRNPARPGATSADAPNASLPSRPSERNG